LQLSRRTDHVETWSPPYVDPYCSRVLEVRPCRDENDEELTLAVYNDVWPLDAITMDEVRSFKQAMLDYGDYLAVLDGVPVGSCAIARNPARPNVAFLILTVLPENRRRGVGTRLFEAASGWCRERGLAEADAPAPEDDPESIAWGERRGFREVGRDGRMLLELNGYDPAPIDPPAGIEIATWAERPGVERGMYEVACEAYPDVPGDRDELMEPFEDWLAHDMTGSGDRPEATFVALAGEEVVGYAKFSLTAARPTTASHDMTAVKRAWRGRGIAGALKRAQIAWAKENGYERLATQNELRNEPIRRLNARLGYRPAPGRVMLRGPISA
jgi:mycothiol synthase